VRLSCRRWEILVAKRKDYDDSFTKCERELKVPYALFFHPEDQELTLYRLRACSCVRPRSDGRRRETYSRTQWGLAGCKGVSKLPSARIGCSPMTTMVSARLVPAVSARGGGTGPAAR
jgi:hypothetical protein